MYFPYLIAKKNEIDALLGLNRVIYKKVIPIIEPVQSLIREGYRPLAEHNVPFILLTNPQYPVKNPLNAKAINQIVEKDLGGYNNYKLGYIVDHRFSLNHLRFFFSNNTDTEKVLLFKFNVFWEDVKNIKEELIRNKVSYLIFDETKTGVNLRNEFINFKKVLIKDGFQRKNNNGDYPSNSQFYSSCNNWQHDGFIGFGDYTIVGDYYQDQTSHYKVVCIHLTSIEASGVTIHHFSSTTDNSTTGNASFKMSEALAYLLNSGQFSIQSTKGYKIFRSINPHKNYAQAGLVRQASIMHHIELMGSFGE